MNEIYFHAEEVGIPPELNQAKTETWLIAIAKQESKQLSCLNYIFCSDDQLLTINKDYLNHDYYTDIITFDYTEGDLVAGDIYISVDRVAENAKAYGVSFEHELMRVVAHGCLHLLGYKDKTDEEQNLMTKKEEASLSLLKEIGVPRGTS